MPIHSEQKILPYSAEQLFDLVVAVDRYPEFLPWCRASRIIERHDNMFRADLIIGFKMITERFGSQVTHKRPESIIVKPTAGPFRRMDNKWRFTDLPEGRCAIDFHVDFEFRSRLLNRLMGALFHEAVRRMVSAFEGRARDLYGEPASTLSADPARISPAS